MYLLRNIRWGDNYVENEILELLKSMQSSINELKDGQQETNKRLDRIEKKLDSVHEQTAQSNFGHKFSQ